MRHALLAALAALAVLGVSACASTPADPAPAAAAAATPAAAPAATADGTKSGEMVASADDAKKLICYDEPGTGTHVRRTTRICATAEEWARRRAESQKALGDLSRRAGQSTPSGR